VEEEEETFGPEADVDRLAPRRPVTDLHDGTEAPRSWSRLLLRTGFVARAVDQGFDMSNENPGNLRFFRGLLAQHPDAGRLSGAVFTPTASTFDENLWLRTFETFRGGAEGGPIGFEMLDLSMMDTYMAGLVRWTNALGTDTTYSCDGHGRGAPMIRVTGNEGYILDACLRLVSRGTWKLRGSEERGHEPCVDRRPANRAELLEMGERLHDRQADLIAVVNAARRSAAAPRGGVRD
jgi:hypothetical protein